MPVTFDAENYNMSHPRRGTAVIFCHENFDNMDRRVGTHLDANRLDEVYKLLGFEVQIYYDLTYVEILNVLSVCKFALFNYFSLKEI